MLGALTHMLLSQGEVTLHSMGGRGLNVNVSSTVIAAHYTAHSWIPAQPASSAPTAIQAANQESLLHPQKWAQVWCA